MGSELSDTSRKDSAATLPFLPPARKLEALISRLLRWGRPYLDEGIDTFEQRYVQRLNARAREMGYVLAPANA